MHCTSYKDVTGSKTAATDTPEKCHAKVLNECLHKNYFNWNTLNSACHCSETINCDSKTSHAGINIYQPCASGKLCQFKKVTQGGDYRDFDVSPL